MKLETIEMLKELEYELFESEEHAPVRDFLNDSPKNDSEPEDIDIIFDRIEKRTPAMRKFVNSVLNVSCR